MVHKKPFISESELEYILKALAWNKMSSTEAFYSLLKLFWLSYKSNDNNDYFFFHCKVNILKAGTVLSRLICQKGTKDLPPTFNTLEMLFSGKCSTQHSMTAWNVKKVFCFV